MKIHAPFDDLCDIAEDMKMKLPIKENDVVIKSWLQQNLPSVHQFIKKNDPFVVKDSTVKEEPNFFVATFDKSRLSEYIGSSNRDEFFSPAERSRFVNCRKLRKLYLVIVISHNTYETERFIV